MLGILQNTDGGSSCHCVADNFDVNVDTKTGHDRTHVMGIIAWKSGQSAKVCKPISKVKVHASQFSIANGNIGEIILQYRPRSQPPSYVDVNIRKKIDKEPCLYKLSAS